MWRAISHFSAFTCATVTKQQGKQLLAWWCKRNTVPTQIKSYECTQVGAEQLNKGGLDQAIEQSVKAT